MFFHLRLIPESPTWVVNRRKEDDEDFEKEQLDSVSVVDDAEVFHFFRRIIKTCLLQYSQNIKILITFFKSFLSNKFAN